jgi:hypothetical protein
LPKNETGIQNPNSRDMTEVLFGAVAILGALMIWNEMNNELRATLLIIFLDLVMIVASVIQAVKRRKTAWWPRLLIPPIITAALIFLPFSDTFQNSHRAREIAAREEVVQLIKSGKLKYDGQVGNVRLPAEYADLAENRYVSVERTSSGSFNVFFPMVSAILHLGGYVYVAEDSVESAKRFALGGAGFVIIDTIKKLRDHWYWVGGG